MKLLYCFILATTVALAVGAQVKSDRDEAGLVGPVKSVAVRSYRFMGSADTDKGSRLVAGDTVKYLSNGSESERIMVSDFGEQMGQTANTFDKDGFLATSVWTDAKGTVVQNKSIVWLTAK